MSNSIKSVLTIPLREIAPGKKQNVSNNTLENNRLDNNNNPQVKQEKNNIDPKIQDDKNTQQNRKPPSIWEKPVNVEKAKKMSQSSIVSSSKINEPFQGYNEQSDRDSNRTIQNQQQSRQISPQSSQASINRISNKQSQDNLVFYQEKELVSNKIASKQNIYQEENKQNSQRSITIPTPINNEVNTSDTQEENQKLAEMKAQQLYEQQQQLMRDYLASQNQQFTNQNKESASRNSNSSLNKDSNSNSNSYKNNVQEKDSCVEISDSESYQQPRYQRQSSCNGQRPYQSIHRHKNTANQLNILTNRINKLILEENQLDKKADDIQRKVEKQYHNKLRTERQLSKRKAEKTNLGVEEIPFTNPLKQMEIAKCKLSRQYVIDRKREEALAVKMSLARMNNEKMKQMIRHRSCLRDQVLKVQQEEMISKQQQNYNKMERMNEIKREQEEEMRQQQIIQQQEDELLEQLEQIEFEQLAKLNQTKRRTRDAQVQLQFQQNHDVKDFEQRFGQQKIKKSNKESTWKDKGMEEKPKRNKPTLYYLEKDGDGVTRIRTTPGGS